jgi:hypothetical protein
MAPRYPRKFLAGSFLNTFSPTAPVPTPLTFDAPTKKRGRPFANGERRKTAAEIKRDQRRREKEEIEEINRSRAEHIAKEAARDAAKRDLFERLRIAELNEDHEEAYWLHEELHGLIVDQHNYDLQTHCERERAAKQANTTRVAVVDNKKLKKLGLNGEFQAKGLPSLNAGLFLSEAEQGKGEIIYGAGVNLNSGRLQINGKNIPRSRAEGRRVMARGTDPQRFETKKHRERDVTPYVNLSKWIHAQKPKRRKKDEVVAPVTHETAPCCFVPDCGEPAVGVHPEDVRVRLADARFVCRCHAAELGGHPSKADNHVLTQQDNGWSNEVTPVSPI